jgi:6,7-dimethyl-8-ribityllumazine synthase
MAMGTNLNQEPDHYTEPTQSMIGSLDGAGLSIGIVCARFNQAITKSLLMGAMDGLTKHGVSEDAIRTHWVPGAFEVPLITDLILPEYDAVIAIACVIRGDTPHFDYVCNGITSGLTSAIHTHQKPAIFCVLTTDTVEQAEVRSKPNSTDNKGYEAALGAIEMATLTKSI